MNSQHLTLILPVYNEQYKIRRVINQYRDIARLIVVDNFSEDGTVEVLKELGVEFVQWQNAGTYQTPEFMTYVKSIIDTKYILILSASEFIPQPLLNLYLETAKLGKFGMISSAIETYTCGEFIPLWGSKTRSKKRTTERFFNLDELQIEKVFIHKAYSIGNPQRVFNSPIESDFTIKHLRDVDTYSLLTKHLGYARVQANQMSNIGKNYSFGRLILMAVKEQIRFLKLPFKYWNFVSFREIAARLLMHLAVYLIAHELKHDRSLEYSRRKTDEFWDELVREHQR